MDLMTPLRRRGRVSKKKTRVPAIAAAAWALARDRVIGKVPPARKRRGGKRRFVLAGGAAAGLAAAVGVLTKQRERIGRLVRKKPDETAPKDEAAPPVTPHAPGPSNYDVDGPPANPATRVPAPEPRTASGELTEEQAAAAEAGSIGGRPTEYASSEPGVPAPPSERPVAEGGGGEAEGQEQAEAEMVDKAAETEPGRSDAQAQIDEAIDEASRPTAGEQAEPVATGRRLRLRRKRGESG